MSSILKYGDWFYYQYYIGGKKKVKALKTKEKATASRLKKLYDAKLELAITGLAPKRIDLQNSLIEFLDLKKTTLKPRSFERYTELITIFQTFFEKNHIKSWDKVTSEVINDFVVDRQKAKRAPKTIDDELTLLKGIIRWLVQEARLQISPVRKWPVMKTIAAHPERLGYYTKEELKKLKEYFRFREFGPGFLFALYTGCRKEEMEEARVRDIHLSDNIIYLRNLKTESDSENQFRLVQIHAELGPVLVSRIKDRKPDDYLFPEVRFHSHNWPHIQMRAACKTLGISYKRFHGLRHTFATYLLAGGVDLRQAMAALGHKRMETTQRYTHLAKQVADLKKLDY